MIAPIARNARARALCKKDPNPQAEMSAGFCRWPLAARIQPLRSLYGERPASQGYLYRDFPEDWLSSSATKGLAAAVHPGQRGVFHAPSMQERRKPLNNPGLISPGRWARAVPIFWPPTPICWSRRGSSVAFINANKRFDELKGMAISARGLFEKRWRSSRTAISSSSMISGANSKAITSAIKS
jgi:hypothetical protein